MFVFCVDDALFIKYNKISVTKIIEIKIKFISIKWQFFFYDKYLNCMMMMSKPWYIKLIMIIIYVQIEIYVLHSK